VGVTVGTGVFVGVLVASGISVCPGLGVADIMILVTITSCDVAVGEILVSGIYLISSIEGVILTLSLMKKLSVYKMGFLVDAKLMAMANKPNRERLKSEMTLIRVILFFNLLANSIDTI
jgi:hypothetical protein